MHAFLIPIRALNSKLSIYGLLTLANCPTNKFRDAFFAWLTITTRIDLAGYIYKEKGKRHAFFWTRKRKSQQVELTFTDKSTKAKLPNCI